MLEPCLYICINDKISNSYTEVLKGFCNERGKIPEIKGSLDSLQIIPIEFLDIILRAVITTISFVTVYSSFMHNYAFLIQFYNLING